VRRILGEVLYLEEKSGEKCTTGTLTMLYFSYNIIRAIKYGEEDGRVLRHIYMNFD